MKLDIEPVEPTAKVTVERRIIVARQSVEELYRTGGSIDYSGRCKLSQRIEQATSESLEQASKILDEIERELGIGTTTDRETLVDYRLDDWPAVERQTE